jgi:hypothetical protein
MTKSTSSKNFTITPPSPPPPRPRPQGLQDLTAPMSPPKGPPDSNPTGKFPED